MKLEKLLEERNFDSAAHMLRSLMKDLHMLARHFEYEEGKIDSEEVVEEIQHVIEKYENSHVRAGSLHHR